MTKHYIVGQTDTIAGKIHVVTPKWIWADVWGAIKVRWSFGRMNYTVKQGLYAIGNPNESSDVFVSANYKLSFDHLRRGLEGLNAWILVLDTKGVNVWCAAGKGTFGTRELVYRIKVSFLNKMVNHNKVIVPQLGAVGVSAKEVKAQTGFSVIYGPVRANDIKAFVANGYKASKEMRTVTFPLFERAKLVPVEIVYSKYYLLSALALIFVLSGINSNGYSIETTIDNGWKYMLNLFVAYLAGGALTPILLPYIPFRSFSMKGFVSGLIIFGILLCSGVIANNLFSMASWLLITTAISSFLAMNFTGASTYTSLSGVKKEMKIAMPLQIIALCIGLISLIVSQLIN